MNEYISEKTVREILKHKDELLVDIQRKEAALLKELDQEELIRERCLASVGVSQTTTKSGVLGDLSNVIVEIEKKKENRRKELCRLLLYLSNQEELINKVWAGYLILNRPYYTVIKKLYVENGAYYPVQQEVNLSASQFERYRKKGIQDIIEYAKSDHITYEIML